MPGTLRSPISSSTRRDTNAWSAAAGNAVTPARTAGRNSMIDPSTLATQRPAPRDTTDGPRSHSFWKTLPGVLTAVAAVITAAGGTIAILLQAGIIGGIDNSPGQPASATRPTTVAAATTSAPTASVSAGKPWTDMQARITAKDGTKTMIRAETLRFCFSGGAGINLNDSLDIAFEKMSLIEVLRSDVALSPGGKATLRVTLTSGTTKEGTITSGCDFFGQAEEGRYSLYPDKLQKIEFLR
jgi:serine/threonine-protein kinase